jgi:fused signal recognition particle receptor
MGFFRNAFEAIKKGLAKTAEVVGAQFRSLLLGRTLSEELIDEIETRLIAADVGVKAARELVDGLRKEFRSGTVSRGEDALEYLKKSLKARWPAVADSGARAIAVAPTKPTVVLVVGVNGVGKTTSVAKIAKSLKDEGRTVLLAAADTFRAAAVEQLQRWGDRLDIPVVKGNPNADPSSVCFNAHQKAIAAGTQFLICDTAGRIHTRHNLMEELGKIRRTIAKQDETAPHLTLLVVDATTGSNALQQAKEFHKASPLDGLIVTKLDGSGKGGIAVTIQDQLGITPRFIGTGEEPDAFAIFRKESFVKDIL